MEDRTDMLLKTLTELINAKFEQANKRFDNLELEMQGIEEATDKIFKKLNSILKMY